MKNTLLALLLLAGIASASTTVNLSGTGRFKAFDPDTGALLAGGSLCSFIGGTTTPNTTYADSTGATANSVCVTLDGSGEAAIWLDPAVVYRLVLKDSSGAQIWMLDNVNTPAAGTFTTLTVSGAATFSSTMTATNFVSNVATGTQPYAATSTTKNTNLNADLLDGGDFGSPPVGLGSTVRTPGTTQLTTLNVSGASTVSGNSTLATANMTGLFTTYNNIACVANCFPQELATIDLTTQGASIGAATLYTVPSSGAGMYRVSCYAIVTRAATTTSTLPACNVLWIDKDGGASVNAIVAASNAGNALTTLTQGTTVISVQASSTIQYSTSGFATSGGTSMQYAVHLRIEAM